MVNDEAGRDSSALSQEQRRLILGISLVAIAVSAVPSTYNFILNPMLAGLGASESQESLMRQLPSIAALLVIFLGASMGTRWGERRLIFVSTVIFSIGCVLVGIAPALPLATVGLMLISATTSAMAVVGLGMISSGISTPRARATAFATIALIAPAVYMVLPVIAGLILDVGSWRLVPVVWLASGLLATWGSRRRLPTDDMRSRRPELVTPALAGLALAAGVQTITAINGAGMFSSQVAVRAAVTITSAVLFWLCCKLFRDPSVSMTVLRRGGVLLLLAVVIIVPFVNLWYYMTLAYQYVFEMTALQTAALLAPAQLAGVGGALLARKLIRERGITFTGVALLLCLAASLAVSSSITASSSVTFIVVLMSVYALASVGAGVPVTNALMNAAHGGEDANTSAFRGASMHIGTALGVVVMSTIVFGAINASLEDSLGGQGAPADQAQQIAASIRDGASSEDVSAQYAVPLEEVNEIDDSQQAAMISGLHVQGVAGAVAILTATGVFYFARRRQGAHVRSTPTV